MAYQNSGNYKKAIKSYENALNHNLNNENVLYELAYCLDITGKLQESISYYRRFIDKDPYSQYGWYNLGIVYNKLENFEEAITSYEFAIDERFASAYFNLGNTYMSISEFTKALDAYKKTLDIEGPTSETACCIGVAYEKLEQYDLGIKYYQKAIKLDNFNDEAWYGVGMCLNAQDKWYESIHFLPIKKQAALWPSP